MVDTWEIGHQMGGVQKINLIKMYSGVQIICMAPMGGVVNPTLTWGCYLFSYRLYSIR